MADTPNLVLPYLEAAQAQKHVTHNDGLRALDAVVQLQALDRDLATPPASPANGARYIVAASPTGAWAGQAGKIAAFQDGAWAFYAPKEGWLAWVADENILLAHDGAAWGGVSFAAIQGLALLGVNATADTTNRLAVASAASLFTHAGAGHQHKINKNAAADTASLLFQTNFSGRAEMGLAGDDDFRVKVSADGSTWKDALAIARSTGAITFPSSAYREVLTADRTYYVRTDGNNANSGLANTSGGAFLTIQKALDVVAGLDRSIYTVTIQIGDGTYTAGATWSGGVGSGPITVQGNASTPANVLVSTTGAHCFDIYDKITVKDLEVRTTTTGYGFFVTPRGYLSFSNIVFGACADGHVRVDTGFALATGSYTINGGTMRHILVKRRGVFQAASLTVTLTGTPAWGDTFILGREGSVVDLFSVTMSGAATGKRYTIDANAVIQTYGAGTASTYFPGNTNGTTATGAQQV